MNDDYITESPEELEARKRRRARLEEMKRRKKKAILMQRCILGGGCLLIVLCIIGAVALTKGIAKSSSEKKQAAIAAQEEEAARLQEAARLEQLAQEAALTQVAEPTPEPTPTPEPKPPVYSARVTADTAGLAEDIVSAYGVLIDVEKQEILAQREAFTRISPASMTKVLTVLTAAELLGISADDLDSEAILNDTFTMNIEITDYCYINDCSSAGFDIGEEITIRDLFYGTILPSGADAALGLAYYTCGSQEAFVEKMNEKLAELEMEDTTHFTNCIGLYDDNHYSTVYDIAIILKVAADNSFCREVMNAHTYNTSATEQHADGILLSNWFLRRIEDKDTHGEVLCGKTGYVDESRSCAASLAADYDGREYLCVTVGSTSSKRCVRDHADIYSAWLPDKVE